MFSAELRLEPSTYYSIRYLYEIYRSDGEDRRKVVEIETDVGRCCGVNVLKNFSDYDTFRDPAMFSQFVAFLKNPPWRTEAFKEKKLAGLGYPTRIFFAFLSSYQKKHLSLLFEKGKEVYSFRNAAHGPNTIHQVELDLDSL